MDCKLLLGSLPMVLCLRTIALIVHSWSVLLDLSGQDPYGFVKLEDRVAHALTMQIWSQHSGLC